MQRSDNRDDDELVSRLAAKLTSEGVALNARKMARAMLAGEMPPEWWMDLQGYDGPADPRAAYGYITKPKIFRDKAQEELHVRRLSDGRADGMTWRVMPTRFKSVACDNTL